MIKKILAFYLTAVSSTIIAQNKENDSVSKNIEEIKISSGKKFDKKRQPSQIEQITKKDIEFQNYQSTAEMLQNSGAVFVQKSQQGGGSPVIRGFESSRVLLMVDGIRMNNLIFRAGHLQNVISVDENLLDNVIIHYGPTSSLYGSDALGGSVNMITKQAQFNSGLKLDFGTRFSTVNQEKSIFFDLVYGTNKWTSLTAVSYNDFGDLKMGKRKNHNGDFFGERNKYVETRIDTETGLYKDYLVENEDRFIQKFSGYKQVNFMQKLNYKTKENFLYGLNLQYSTSSNIPRYDRLTDKNGNGLRSAEWYYGPQQRLLGIFSVEKEDVFTNTDFKIDASYQEVRESRHNRRFNNYNLQNQIENVSMYALNAHFETKKNSIKIYYGTENYFETLTSKAFSNNINTGIISPLKERYPNGDNNMLRNEIYIASNFNNDNINLSAGLRGGHTSLNSSIADNTLFKLPFDKISQKNYTYSANFGINYLVTENSILKANIGTGFRVPNIDDLAKVFENVQATATVIGTLFVPNENLKPEKTITYDMGIVLQTEKKDYSVETTFYYTEITDAIVTDKFTFNGQSQVVFNGFTSNVFANQNFGKAFITGLSIGTSAEFVKNLILTGTFNYTKGRIIEEDKKRTKLDHIAPYFGKIALSYTKPKWITLELSMLYNGQKPIEEYRLTTEDNEQYAPENGIPAWECYNFKVSKSFLKNSLTINAGVENILDTQYRNFASGINAPGRNFYGSLKYSF